MHVGKNGKSKIANNMDELLNYAGCDGLLSTTWYIIDGAITAPSVHLFEKAIDYYTQRYSV